MPPKKPTPYGPIVIGSGAGDPVPVPSPALDRVSQIKPLLNLEEESRLARIRARVHNGHAEHTDARFLLELLERYMA